MLQGPSLVDCIPGVSGSATFPKSSASFPVLLPSSAAGALSLDSMASMQGAAFTFTASGDWPQDTGRCEAFSLKPEALGVHQGALPSNAADFAPGKHEHKPGGGAKHQPAPLYPSPVAPSQKLSLDKYREKHAAELAGQKRRQELSQEAEPRDAYAPPALLEQTYHRKHPQPPPGSDKHPADKRDKGASLKLRLPVPAPEKAAGSKEELKMKIKVSSDEGGAKSRHSGSPLVSKEKHRDHSHRHHKHSHGHGHSQSGNGQAAGGAPFRAPAAVGGEATLPASGSSRKRAHPDATHNHHHSKSSKSGKSAGSSSHLSSVKQCVSSLSSDLNPPFPPPPVTHQVGYEHLNTLVKLDRRSRDSRGPGANANGQHTDYKDTFDMLDSLLSAQGMNS